jgi:uncharacterized protein YgiM (DUF1202 family)
MHGFFGRPALAGLLILMSVMACNYPNANATEDVAGTKVAETLTAFASGASVQQAASTDTAAPVPTDIQPPSATPTQAKPVVIHDALCSQGPGNNYEVVSSVKTGTVVEIIGRGSIAGWFIITNPIYHDPCWIASVNLQIDPGFNVSGLRVYNPPSSPTPRPTRTPVPTP